MTLLLVDLPLSLIIGPLLFHLSEENLLIMTLFLANLPLSLIIRQLLLNLPEERLLVVGYGVATAFGFFV